MEQYTMSKDRITMDNTLFYTKDLSSVLQSHSDSIRQYVEKIPQTQFLNCDDESIAEHVFSEMEILPIELHEEQKTMEPTESKMDVSHDYRRNPFRDSVPIYVPSLRVTISIPFTGTAELWHLKPNQWSSILPRGYINRPNHTEIGSLLIVIEKPSGTDPEEYKKDIEDNLKNIRFYLNNQRNQLVQHHQELRGMIKVEIFRRRKNLEHFSTVNKALNIPLFKREGVPDISQIPIKRKLVKPLPQVSNKPSEPGISKEDYEHILDVIRHVGATFESTPRTYKGFVEEQLRDVLLANLNGHYKGDATGETFRNKGKTDIRIEFENRSAFVGECKVWHGEKNITEAIDQMIGYTTWRDCKTSLIVFNKNITSFKGIQDKIPNIFESHSQHLKALNSNHSGEWRYVLKSSSDEERLITVHVFLFNLYTGEMK